MRATDIQVFFKAFIIRKKSIAVQFASDDGNWRQQRRLVGFTLHLATSGNAACWGADADLAEVSHLLSHNGLKANKLAQIAITVNFKLTESSKFKLS